MLKRKDGARLLLGPAGDSKADRLFNFRQLGPGVFG